MKRYFLLIILVALIFSSHAFGQNFKVVYIEEDLKQAVLYDRDTGEEWSVQTGDEIDGWKVVKITLNYVALAKQEQDIPIVMKIPVNERIEKNKERPATQPATLDLSTYQRASRNLFLQTEYHQAPEPFGPKVGDFL